MAEDTPQGKTDKTCRISACPRQAGLRNLLEGEAVGQVRRVRTICVWQEGHTMPVALRHHGQGLGRAGAGGRINNTDPLEGLVAQEQRCDGTPRWERWTPAGLAGRRAQRSSRAKGKASSEESHTVTGSGGCTDGEGAASGTVGGGGSEAKASRVHTYTLQVFSPDEPESQG